MIGLSAATRPHRSLERRWAAAPALGLTAAVGFAVVVLLGAGLGRDR